MAEVPKTKSAVVISQVTDPESRNLLKKVLNARASIRDNENQAHLLAEQIELLISQLDEAKERIAKNQDQIHDLKGKLWPTIFKSDQVAARVRDQIQGFPQYDMWLDVDSGEIYLLEFDKCIKCQAFHADVHEEDKSEMFSSPASSDLAEQVLERHLKERSKDLPSNAN